MLDKSFDPDAAERRLYALWEEAGRFAAAPGSDAAPFTIMIPPPNVTGTLHMGHALTMTLQDILIRWRRMQGRDALWQPGTDHAGIATQMVVERQLDAQGIRRSELGRDAFVEKVWDWKAQSGGGITRQLRRLGASLDWSRERFTMDEGLSAAVREVFVRLHREGLIVRARRLVNWDPSFRSAISDLEVESREVRGHLWTIRYPVEGEPGRFLSVATTRPETMLGDTAVAVHPDGPALRRAGRPRFVVLPLDRPPGEGGGGRVFRSGKGHGCGQDHAGARLQRLRGRAAAQPGDALRTRRRGADRPGRDRGGLRTVPGLADPSFVRALAGQTRDAARTAIVAELERLDLLEKVEPHLHQVPHAERGGAVVEPRLTIQWYCDAARLAGPAIAAVEDGRVAFVPRQWENTFFAWMRDIQPWCISRQLWWGHRIPAWYGPDGHVFVAHDEAEAARLAQAHYGDTVSLTRDEDVLDTWFSSALWPFSTLGWPERTPELARYYPTNVLVTGHDIIFFWVARMMMMGLHLMEEVPFRQVFIHGLVRDERGQKMSKSKGNGIDPLELIDQYGADALRFTICALTGQGRDVKLGPKRVEEYRSFVTKIWNAARFCEMNGVRLVDGFQPEAARGRLARWILDEAAGAVAEAGAALEAYRYDEYAASTYRFTWNRFCDWFLEFAKPVFNAGDAAEAAELRAATAHVLGTILRLLHPVMPFVTETLWAEFGFGAEGSLIVAPWPEAARLSGADEVARELDWVTRFIGEIRAIRAEMNVPPSKVTPVLLRDASAATVARADAWSEAIGRMARVSRVSVLDGEVPAEVAQVVVDEATLILPLAGVIDLAAERARLHKERARALDEAAKVERKLGNADFVARARPEVVDEHRDRLSAFRQEMARLDAALRRIG